jgi:hypothetical protein
LLLDPALGDEGLEAAQSLLSWYSPYVHLDDPATGAAASLWQDIATRLAASEDPLVRARGEGILRTGDPQFGDQELPEVAGAMVVLDRWPETLPALQFAPVDRWAESYPARAVRDEIGGMSGVSALFGPDGAFEKLWISRPSGSIVLDEAAIRNAEHYLRPKVSELRLDGFAGSHVLVPLVDIEWHLGGTPDRPVGAQIADGRAIVVAQPIAGTYSCGFF